MRVGQIRAFSESIGMAPYVAARTQFDSDEPALALKFPGFRVLMRAPPSDETPQDEVKEPL